MTRAKKIGLAAAVAAAAAIAAATVSARLRSTTAQAAVSSAHEAPRSGGNERQGPWGHAGAGWSLDADTERAVAQAVGKATEGTGGDGLVMLFYTPQHDPQRVASALTAAAGPHRRTLAMTTHDGLLSSDGYHTAETGAVGALWVDLASVTVGLGAASFRSARPEDATRTALSQAIGDAHETPARRPALLVVFCTMRSEEATLDAIAREVGPDVPLIGGTAAGLVGAMERKTDDVASSMILDGRVIEHGVAIAAFYSPDAFAVAYGGGFDRGSARKGVITSSEARLIETIDHRPAVDVYDEWLGGRLSEARAAGQNVQNVLALYPLVQTVTRGNASHNQFVRAWPSGDPSAPGSLRTGADVHDGEVVYTSEGSENILLNHFSSLPRQARQAMGGGRAAAGLFFYCAGALQTIPREHRGVLAALVQRSMGDIPWIGLFSWGEQGSVPGIGYQHGNLMASTVLFPATPAR